MPNDLRLGHFLIFSIDSYRPNDIFEGNAYVRVVQIGFTVCEPSYGNKNRPETSIDIYIDQFSVTDEISWHDLTPYVANETSGNVCTNTNVRGDGSRRLGYQIPDRSPENNPVECASYARK